MPVMDGLTATRKIRAWEAENNRSPTPIIALTASALKGDREKCLAAGCTAFLTKPIKQQVLLQAIRENSLTALSSPVVASPKRDLAAHIHPRLAARIPAFLQNRRQDVVALENSLSRGDYESVERLAHSMKGAGASFGFQTITQIGAALEQEAQRGDRSASHKSVEDLSTYLDSLGRETVMPLCLPETQGERAGVALRIVLVDDNDDLRMCFREILQEKGHHVEDAGDGAEGLALILAVRPDIAIVDIGMFGMDGYEVAAGVRASLGRSVRLVALTGYEKESDRLKAIAAGFDAHLTKPVDIARLELILSSNLAAVACESVLPLLPMSRPRPETSILGTKLP
jgi:CheY-like chemotaxis protein